MVDFSKLSPRRFDWILAGAALLLVALGLTAVYSVDLSRGGELALFRRQLLSAGIGVVLLFGASLLNQTVFRTAAKFLYGVTLSLLVGVLFFGANIRGTRGWFTFQTFSFQPVELAKAAVILILAAMVYHFGRRFDRFLFFVGTAVAVFLPTLLVLFQPDVGSAALLALVWLSLMVLLKARSRYVVGFVAVAVIFGVVSWGTMLKPYQKERVQTFLNPERDPLGAGYNVTQAIIAVGSGRYLGRGLGLGSQSQLKFLPEAQTDFIFSVIAEELGLAGVLVLFGLFSVIWWRLFIIMRFARDDFVATASAGILLLFFIQFVVNVGANVGLLPVTGVTLPLVSYGGSSLIVSLFLLGVAESMVEKKY